MEDWVNDVLKNKKKATNDSYLDTQVSYIWKDMNVQHNFDKFYQLGVAAGYASCFYLLEKEDLSKEDILKIAKENFKNYPYIISSIDYMKDELEKKEKSK